MNPLPIVAYGNDILRTKTIPVESVEVAKDIIEKLKATMSPIKTAVGLAAPQIGSNLSAFIMRDYPAHTLISVINPTIVKRKGLEISTEGCLSIPNVNADVIDRNEEVEVVFYDENLKRQRIKLKKFAGKIFQHEYDHLNGILFVDRISKEEMDRIESQLAFIESGKIQVHYDMIFKPEIK